MQHWTAPEVPAVAARSFDLSACCLYLHVHFFCLFAAQMFARCTHSDINKSTRLPADPVMKCLGFCLLFFLWI